MMGSLSRTLDALLALQEAVDRAGETDYFGTSTTSRGVYPPINLFEKDEELVMVAELPGVQKEDLTLEIKENLLRVAGERKIDYGEGVSRHRTERRPFKFDRSLRLPFRVEIDKSKAELKNGILVVALPRAEADKPKQISIN